MQPGRVFPRLVMLGLLTLPWAGGCGGTASDHPPAVAASTPTQNPETPAIQLVRVGDLGFVPGFEAGMRQARAERKPALLFFTAEWCRYCHQMADVAFRDPAVAALASRFVCIRVDADQEAEVCREFRVRGYPTVQFLSANGAPLQQVVGRRSGQQLLVQMRNTLDDLAMPVVPLVKRR